MSPKSFILSTLLSLSLLFSTVTNAQLTGRVGPLTSASSKAAKKTCSIANYGAVADGKTDISGALNSAFNDCKNGGVVVVPAGNYALSKWVTMSGGSAWALQLDGTITRASDDGGNMIFVEHTSDFELFSSHGTGAMQGLGYKLHAQGNRNGARLLRFYEVSDFSVHDIKLVDAPAFHFSMDTCTNGEVYNMAIRGGNEGGLDGIDVWSNNMHIHDIMSPSKGILIENIYCNWSGGCALGSLGADTAISNIRYSKVYTWSSNQMMMIKSNGGSGSVTNATFENFIGHGNAYSLDIDQYWSSMDAVAGNGVKLTDIDFRNWKGGEANGAQRGPIKVNCADGAPCTGVSIEDFAMWTESGSKQLYTCRSGYGSGFCLKGGSGGSYAAVTSTVSAAPTGYQAAKMPDDLVTHTWGTASSIPVPTMPASFYPNTPPISALAR
ncbi:MAG: hypothetical protein Q9162_003964 [Coniocarpon cinnabarinum]